MTSTAGVDDAAGCIVLILLINAEPLRCNGSIAPEGDSSLSIAFKCGSPLLKDSSCARVHVGQLLQSVPEPFASACVPCQPTEEWLSDRGSAPIDRDERARS